METIKVEVNVTLEVPADRIEALLALVGTSQEVPFEVDDFYKVGGYCSDDDDEYGYEEDDEPNLAPVYLQVGSRVSSTGVFPAIEEGTLGTIKAYDAGDPRLPYRVRFDDGSEIWVQATEIEPLSPSEDHLFRVGQRVTLKEDFLGHGTGSQGWVLAVLAGPVRSDPNTLLLVEMAGGDRIDVYSTRLIPAEDPKVEPGDVVEVSQPWLSGGLYDVGDRFVVTEVQEGSGVHCEYKGYTGPVRIFLADWEYRLV